MGGMDGCVHNLEGGVLCCFMNGGSSAGGMVALSLIHTVPAVVVAYSRKQRFRYLSTVQFTSMATKSKNCSYHTIYLLVARNFIAPSFLPSPSLPHYVCTKSHPLPPSRTHVPSPLPTPNLGSSAPKPSTHHDLASTEDARHMYPRLHPARDGHDA